MRFLAKLVLLFTVVCASAAHSQEAKERKSALPRSSPESQGISSSAIVNFLEQADGKIKSMHSFMFVRNGHVVAEAWWKPEAATKPHVLWSLSKSFTSTAVGLAIADGKLSLDDSVEGFFPDEAPVSVSKNLKLMRVRDLLTMSAGHENEVNLRNETNWPKAFLAHSIPHKPGTHFQYNTPATFMLSAIVQKVTGETVLEYLQPRLFEPLGIERPRWDSNPQGITLGGYGLYLKTEDIAKFGQLLLQNGKWNGKQIIPSDWIKQATTKQIANGDNPDNDWNQGYGFQFWRCRHGAFRGDGRSGQFCIVMPELDAVIVMTANNDDMAAQMNLVWEILLPASRDKELPEDRESLAKLKQLVNSFEASR